MNQANKPVATCMQCAWHIYLNITDLVLSESKSILVAVQEGLHHLSVEKQSHTMPCIIYQYHAVLAYVIL